MSDKLPALLFYVGDWRKDPGVQALSYHDRGVWFEIICLMHESEQRGKLMLNGKPMPLDALARLLGLDNQILTTTLTNLSTYGVTSTCPENGTLLCRRMVRDENIRKVRKECGKLGGNPVLVNQIPTTQDKLFPTPSSSSSSSSSSSEERKKEEYSGKPPIDGKPESLPAKKKSDPVPELEIPEHLRTPEFLNAWEDWKTYLPSKHKQTLPKLYKTLQYQLKHDLGKWTVEEAIQSIIKSISRGWRGLFKPEGVNNAPQPPARNGYPPPVRPEESNELEPLPNCMNAPNFRDEGGEEWKAFEKLYPRRAAHILKHRL